MITRQQKKWLESSDKTEDGKFIKNGAKHAVYMSRIQKRIDKELNALTWLAQTYPQIFLDEEKEMRDTTGKITPHRRLKAILKILMALNPKMEVEMVLKRLDAADSAET